MVFLRASDNVYLGLNLGFFPPLFLLGAIKLFHNEAVANYKAFYVVRRQSMLFVNRMLDDMETYYAI